VSALTDARARALAFIEAHGDEIAARRAGALVGTRSLADALQCLERLQRQDGAFASAPSARAGLAGTLRILGALDDLRALHAPLVGRACAYVEGVQEDDGSLCDAAAASEEERIFATGMLAGHLAKSRFVRPALLESAGIFLGATWSPDRVRGFAWRAIAAYAHYFANVPHDLADGALQWCGRELERGLRTRHFDAVRTARVFAWCDAHALPGARIGRDELVRGVIGEQAADGGWSPQGGTTVAARVAHSLDALVALVRLA
jgi:hypothetical protein